MRYSFFRELITKAFILAGALCSSFLGLSDFEDQKWTLLWFRKLEDFLVTANSLHKNFYRRLKIVKLKFLAQLLYGKLLIF